MYIFKFNLHLQLMKEGAEAVVARGIHGNPKSSNHQVPLHSLIEQVETLVSPDVLTIQPAKVGGSRKTKTCHKHNQSSEKLHLLTDLVRMQDTKTLLNPAGDPKEHDYLKMPLTSID